MTKMLHKNSDKFALEILKFFLEEINSGIKNPKECKRSWKIIRIDTCTITTILRKLTFERSSEINR